MFGRNEIEGLSTKNLYNRYKSLFFAKRTSSSTSWQQGPSLMRSSSLFGLVLLTRELIFPSLFAAWPFNGVVEGLCAAVVGHRA